MRATAAQQATNVLKCVILADDTYAELFGAKKNKSYEVQLIHIVCSTVAFGQKNLKFHNFLNEVSLSVFLPKVKSIFEKKQRHSSVF